MHRRIMINACRALALVGVLGATTSLPGLTRSASAAPTTGSAVVLSRTASRAFEVINIAPDASAIAVRGGNGQGFWQSVPDGVNTPLPSIRAIDRNATVGLEFTDSGVTIHDLVTHTTTHYQTTFMSGFGPVDAIPIGDAAISANGRFVTFRGSSGTIGLADLFLLDRTTNSMARLGDRFPAGCRAQTQSPAFSADGSTMYFATWNLGTPCPDALAGFRTWRIDPAGGAPTEVHFLPDGQLPTDNGSPTSASPIATSATGRYLLFRTYATNVVESGGDAALKLLMLDTATTTVTLVANRPVQATLSDSGGRIAFVSEYLLPSGATNRAYVYDMSSNTLSALALPSALNDPFALPLQAFVTPDGGRVVLNASTTDPGTPGADGSIFRGDLAARRGGDEARAQVPERILDTRVPIGVQAAAPLAGGGTIELQVGGAHGVPSDAAGAVLNVTVDQPAGPGFVTIWPCGRPRPTASNLNFVANQSIPNLVVTALGTGGKVCLFSSQRAHLIADLSSVLPGGSLVTTATPQRILDTREPIGVSKAVPLAAGSTLRLDVAGSFDVPVNAKAAILNVTVDRPAAAGYLTVHPCLPTPPTASNLNYTTGETIPNAVLAPLSEGGQICITVQQRTDVIVDLAGYVDDDAAYTPTGPSRVLDTREARGLTTGSPQPAHQILELSVANDVDAPSSASAAVLNVTVDQPAGPGFVTVWPCGQPMPIASNLNFVRNETIPNLVLTQIGAGGKVCFFATQATHLIVDLDGYLPAA